MTAHRNRPVVSASLLMAGAVAMAGCTAGTASKAGGDLPAIRLTMGTEDVAGRESGQVIEEFARQVADRTDGSVTIEARHQPAGENQPDWDQKVARMVVAGDLDLGVIPARAWDTEGVTSLRALHAPLLVDSDPLLDAVVTDGVADEMLAGLDGTGVTGLALVPEGLRHLFSFDRPVRAPADLNGLVVRAPHSALAFEMLTVVGADPTESAGPGHDFVQEVADGTIDVVETTYSGAVNLARDGMVAANLTLYPKVFSLVVNDESLAGLSEDQQQALRQAAAATTAWAVDTMPDDAESRADLFCGYGLRAVLASKADLASWAEAMKPVYAELESDPATRQALDRIRELKESTPPGPTPEPCGDSAEVAGRETTEADDGDSSLPDGTYRRKVTLGELTAAGADDSTAADYVGLHTLTFADGDVTVLQRGYDPCLATYTAASDRLSVRFRTGCTGTIEASWRIADDELVLSDAEDPSSKVGTALVAGVFNGTWQRID